MGATAFDVIVMGAGPAGEVLAGRLALPNGHRHICYSHPGPADAGGDRYHTARRLSPTVLA